VLPCRYSEPSATEYFIRGYLDHLHSDRGLCARSIEVYAPFVRAFVTAQRLPEYVTSLDASAIRGYLLDGARNRSVSFVRLLTAALRSFLHFLFLDGRTEVDLSTAVPPVRRWRFAAVPPLLTPEEVEKTRPARGRGCCAPTRRYPLEGKRDRHPWQGSGARPPSPAR
jgi:integrase/recombinase XerD